MVIVELKAAQPDVLLLTDSLPVINTWKHTPLQDPFAINIWLQAKHHTY